MLVYSEHFIIQYALYEHENNIMDSFTIRKQRASLDVQFY